MIKLKLGDEVRVYCQQTPASYASFYIPTEATILDIRNDSVLVKDQGDSTIFWVHRKQCEKIDQSNIDQSNNEEAKFKTYTFSVDIRSDIPPDLQAYGQLYDLQGVLLKMRCAFFDDKAQVYFSHPRIIQDLSGFSGKGGSK